MNIWAARPESGAGMDGLYQALDTALRNVSTDTFGVAVSGGPDSFALAVLANRWARANGKMLHIFHVHHGLQSQADKWAQDVGALADELQLPCEITRVQVADKQGTGVEAAARDARYAALGEMAQRLNIRHVLLAHHLDDQAETVLLRLLRGAGPEGMGAMAAQSGRDGLTYLRPWLEVERANILVAAHQLASTMQLTLADDPTNLDARYARGALRRHVMPALATHWPGYRQTLSRFARLVSNSAVVLQEVAEADLATLLRPHPAYGDTLELSAWRALSVGRRQLVLRAWLTHLGQAMPSEARLYQMVEQLSRAASDRQVLLRHGEVHLRRHRDRIMLERRRGTADVEPEAARPEEIAVELQWGGEPEVYLPSLGGTLCFEAAEEGLDPEWLKARPLRVGLRRGRERLQPSSEGPSRSLKNLYQEAGIPAWERTRLPLVWRGGTLVFAAGLGLDARVARTAPGILLQWRADSPGATTRVSGLV